MKSPVRGKKHTPHRGSMGPLQEQVVGEVLRPSYGSNKEFKLIIIRED